MASQLSLVTKLQRALSEAADLDALLSGIPDWMQELHDEHSSRKTEIETLETALEEAASDRRAAEATDADCQEKLKSYQDQISQVRNQREYGALLQEIDTVKNQIRECEEQALAALERYEVAEKSRDEAQGAFTDLDTRYSESLEKWEAEKPDIAQQAEGVKREIEELEKALPPNVLVHFRRVFERHHGNAMAAVQEVQQTGKKGAQIWHCGACNYRVRPQAVVEIANRGTLVPCDSCKRILYIAEAEA
ncbi:MAG: zinc ribbon domain-containing protein [Thermoanaerobaculia bacterium]